MLYRGVVAVACLLCGVISPAVSAQSVTVDLGTSRSNTLFEDPLVLGPEIRNKWSPIMKEILPVPNTSSRGIDYGPWNDSPPWRGNEGFDQLPDQTPAAAGAKTSR